MRKDSGQRRLTFPDDVTLVLWIQLDQVVVDTFWEDSSLLVREIQVARHMKRGVVTTTRAGKLVKLERRGHQTNTSTDEKRHTHQINKFPPLHHTRRQARSRHKLSAIITIPFLRLLSCLPVLVDFGGLCRFWWWWLITTWISFHVCIGVCLIIM